MKKKMLICAVVALLTQQARAQAPADDGEWGGEMSAGYLSTSGNADTRSLNAKGALNYFSKDWKNAFTASAINSSDDTGSTAEHYAAGDQLNYNFTPRDYTFGDIEYEKDLFGGIRQHWSETAGYGRHLLTSPEHVLDADIGAGARQDRAQITEEKQNDFIGRASVKYVWTLSPTSSFHQSLKIETGKSNTYMESVTELKLSIIGNLLAALSYTIKNNSAAPAGTESTDTFTAVNLSYAFGKKG